MLQIIKKFAVKLAVAALLLAPVGLVAPAMVMAQEEANIEGSLCGGADLKFGDAGDCTQGGENTEEKLNGLIADIVNIFSIVVGIVAVIMIIVGGFRYITSGGDSGNVTGAKNTILYAIIGLIIVALAQFVVKFVLSKATDLGQ